MVLTHPCSIPSTSICFIIEGNRQESPSINLNDGIDVAKHLYRPDYHFPDQRLRETFLILFYAAIVVVILGPNCVDSF